MQQPFEKDASFLAHLHALRCVQGIGAKTLLALTQRYHPSSVWDGTAKKVADLLSPKTLDALNEMRRTFHVSDEWQKLTDQEISCVWHESDHYPKLLHEIPDFPPLLYIRGTLMPENEHPCIAIVGTRRPTEYGRQATWSLSQDLALAGATIISGLALGLDSTAHEATLDAKGLTIGVLGSGLAKHHISPRSHLQLSERIVSSGGALVSEYPPDTPASTGTFPARNRIIAGISLATVVIEASIESGTLITANLALDYNRDVFAVPGSIFSRSSDGSNNLLRNGARVATNAQDILETITTIQNINGKKKLFNPETLPPEEKKIYLFLLSEPSGFDLVARNTKLDIATITSCLSMMEIKGIVKNIGSGKYAVI